MYLAYTNKLNRFQTISPYSLHEKAPGASIDFPRKIPVAYNAVSRLWLYQQAMDATSSLSGEMTSPNSRVTMYVIDTDNIDGRHAYLAPPDEFKTR